ncbi:MAG: hypothetical protein KAI84_06735 [Gammaproteobacteria bacterium]|nr:hypothetical protein [Gammaproteobacteria bacterium]
MDIDKIPRNVLIAARSRLGADHDSDDRFDYQIVKMTPKELMAKWSGWHLGDESWALNIIATYEDLKEIDNAAKS